MTKNSTASLFPFSDVSTVNETVQPYLSIPEFTMEMKYKTRATKKFVVHSSVEMAQFCRMVIGDGSIEWYESMIVVALNRSNKLINYYRISQGGISGTVADPRMIIQFALACNASSLILCHNHPSGNTKPSKQDEELTQKIKSACGYFDIHLSDHIIVTHDSYYSFADEGLL